MVQIAYITRYNAIKAGYQMQQYLYLKLKHHNSSKAAKPHALATLAAPKSNALPILLKLGDEMIALLNHIHVLLVLVVWSVGLNHLVDAINRARHTVCGDEVGQVPGHVS
jgi:hypothetical protein